MLLAQATLVWASGSSGPPTGTLQDVQHVVILMQENRSFDHYFGSFGGVQGFNDRNAVIFQNGSNAVCQPTATGSIFPFPVTSACLEDVDHSESTSYQSWNNGWCNQWVPAKGSNTMAFYTRSNLSFYYALAEAYTICDAYHSSVLGPTFPNRLYLMTGTIDPASTGGGPVTANEVPANGYSWTTYPERLQAAGISWRVYQQTPDYFPLNALTWFAQYKAARPGNPLYDRGVATVPDLVAAFAADVTNGALPRVSWLVPPWTLSEHPYYSPDSGERLISQLLNALAAAPAVLNSTIFIITYDENGGFFDHVPPPVPPAGTAYEFVNGLPIGLGVRVPTLLISPWSRGGYVCSQVFDHTSILRLLERCTGVVEPNVSAWRRQVCGDLTSAFDFAHPNTNFPALPGVVAVPCTNGVSPQPPLVSVPPVQESAARPARLLPYQPNVTSLLDYTKSRFWVILTNGGRDSVHFAVYPNARRTDGPWPFDVRSGTTISNSFNVLTNGGFYDFSCYGPNGFQRRFAGLMLTNTAPLEVGAAPDLDAGGMVLSLQNPTASSATFTISNGLAGGGLRTFPVGAGQTLTTTFLAVTNYSGWYDLTVTVNTDTNLLRRFAGHLEIGPPQISVALAGPNLALSYPGWAAGQVLESQTNLGGAWSTLGAAANVVSNRTVVSWPASKGPRFFRLRSP